MQRGKVSRVPHSRTNGQSSVPSRRFNSHSKTACREFESFCPCHENSRFLLKSGIFFIFQDSTRFDGIIAEHQIVHAVPSVLIFSVWYSIKRASRQGKGDRVCWGSFLRIFLFFRICQRKSYALSQLKPLGDPARPCRILDYFSILG